MKNANKQQMLLASMILILGLAYMMYKPKFMQPTPAKEAPKNQTVKEQTKNSFLNSDDEPSSQADPKNSLIISNWKTDANNINVYYVNAPELPMVDIQVTFNAGSAHAHQKPGLAALTNSMLLEGTKNRSNDEISEKLESVGARLGTGINRDSSSISLRSLTDEHKLNTSLEILNDILANVNFPNRSFNRVKNQVIEQLKINEQYPEVVSSNAFYQAMYKDHPYGIPVNGTINSLESIRQREVVDFYNKFYVNHNAQIAIVGAVNKEQAIKIANNVAQNLKYGPKAEQLPNIDTTALSSNKHIEFPSTQTHILIGTPGIKRDDPNYFTLLVGNHILGRMPLVSLLFKNVRINHGLAYSISSQFIPMKNIGPFIINMQTRNEKADEAFKISKETLINFLKNGPSEEELNLAKQNLIGQFPVNIASNNNKLEIIANIGYYNLPLNYLDTYVDKINAVTLEQVKAAFNKQINPDQLIVVTVGNDKTSNKATLLTKQQNE